MSVGVPGAVKMCKLPHAIALKTWLSAEFYQNIWGLHVLNASILKCQKKLLQQHRVLRKKAWQALKMHLIG